MGMGRFVSQGAEGTTVLIRTFTNLSKTGWAVHQGAPSTLPRGPTALEQSDLAVHLGVEAAHRTFYLLPASFHNQDSLPLMLWSLFPQKVAWWNLYAKCAALSKESKDSPLKSLLYIKKKARPLLFQFYGNL